MTVETISLPQTDPTTPLNCDLAIVGGGIVGATLALTLKDSGLKIKLIEVQSLEKVASRGRSYALSLLSGKIFDSIGVWSEILPQIGKFRHIRLSDADYPGVVTFETADLGTDYLGYVGDHGVILRTLQKAIADCPNIEWLCPAKVVDVKYGEKEAIVTVEKDGMTQSLHTKLVIGADGPRSFIRSLAQIKTQGWKYWQSCITFTIKHTAPRNDIAFERFCYSGPMGILPLPGNRCQIVWTAPHAQAQELLELDKKEFLEKLQERTQGSLGEITLDSDRYLFPVQLMQSDHYTQSRLALVGDAAHCCHPVGGQGLNLGIRDVAALAQVIQKAYEDGEDIGDIKVLKRYERWRRWENWVILGFTDFLDRFFSNQILPIMMIRRLGLRLMMGLPPFKKLALQLMTGLLGKRPLSVNF
ncbi:FAD-dependent hydroxylase [Crocosphaera chwakensis]|uniref:2-octaprenyl-6-methoxyphenyl hydroxylase n=1 Tax=Crocosphaera chwakensis CCY0110 TaxID=391612 RepID=A3IV85_9CHRO|nr:FAD-dependent hydroxylase [Crocosphaera chwakensis]EAZ89646.1 2-octaprenyl-6-methoxyphenyl hydroxylase [Crocosphaera chwakensis CCY0110]